MSPAVPFLKWLKTYLTEESSFVLKEENFLLNESVEFLMKDDDEYPRFELQVVGSNASQYVTQRVRDKLFAFSLQGFLRRDEDTTTDQDMFDILDFAHETEGILYNIHNLIQAGLVSIPKFIKLNSSDEAYIVLELEPRLSTFVLNFTAEFSYKDNERNN